MRGDFSRFTFDPDNRYSSVVSQQGRLQTDADTNEQNAIVAYRLGVTTRDLVGASGAPKASPGFGLRTRSGMVFAGTGDHVLLQRPEPFEITALTIQCRFLRNPDSHGVLLSLAPDADSSEREALEISTNDRGQVRCSVPAAPKTDHANDRPHTITSETEIPPNTDTVLTLTIDQTGKAALYLNGHRDVTANLSTTRPLTVQLASIGRSVKPLKEHQSLACTVEDIRIWTAARARDEIRREQTAPSRPDLAAWWALASPTQTEIHDGSDNGWNGTLVPDAGGTLPKPAPAELIIGRGRFYVDGFLVENEEETPYHSQRDWPGAQWPPPQGSGWYLASIDVWERAISAAQLPELKEVALAGADTAIRLKTVAQVRLDRLSGDPRANPGLLEDWAEGIFEHDHGATMAARHHGPDITDNRLYRVEIHSRGPCHDTTTPPKGANVTVLPEGGVKLEGGSEDWAVGQSGYVYAGDAKPELVTVTGIGVEQLALDHIPDSLLVAGRGTLVRVAMFKWSRDNASAQVPVDSCTSDDGSSEFHLATWNDSANDLRIGDWVELITDATELDRHPLPLARVKTIDHVGKLVTVDREFEPIHKSDHAVLLRWESALLPVTSAWTDLDPGIQVRFDGSNDFEIPRYWMFPARQAINDIEWPVEDRSPKLLHPSGPAHARGLLAFVLIDTDTTDVYDLRNIFGPAESVSGDVEAWMADVRRVDDELAEEEPDPVAGQLESAAAAAEPASLEQEHLGSAHGLLSDLALGWDDEPPAGYERSGLVLKAVASSKQWEQFASLPEELTGVPRAVPTTDGATIIITSTGQIWRLPEDSNEWIPVFSEFRRPREGFEACVLDDRIHIIGGETSDGEIVGWHDVWDPSDGSWTELADLNPPRANVALVTIGKRLHAVGGTTHGGRSSALHDTFDIPDSGDWKDTKWTPRANLPHRRSRLGLAAPGGVLMAAGGKRSRWSLVFPHSTRTVFVYNGKKNRWHRAKRLRHRRYDAGVTTVADDVVATGGIGWFGMQTASVERYVGDSHQWQYDTPLASHLSSQAISAHESAVTVIGGRRGHQWTTDVSRVIVPRTLTVFERLQDEASG